MVRSFMFYTYILKSLKDQRRYIGYSGNILDRLDSYNTGLNPSTKNRRPFKLICFKIFETKPEATKYERYLKRLKGGKQLEIEIKMMLENAVVAQLVEQLHGKE
ncbi:GIY-YIG nuclease family protein [Patescibacteria group bacterium]|nr:GIY-YIG nuclease family protein [Patescibacteria group bacterium]MBU1062742.1 GIY-YIG nuclease family protein [Patescibacteria group bacterium]MBU1991874.1 GIY-YIG nuclease family protein [Patescibacteria group bacterium]